jgi:hypothetical protein
MADDLNSKPNAEALKNEIDSLKSKLDESQRGRAADARAAEERFAAAKTKHEECLADAVARAVQAAAQQAAKELGELRETLTSQQRLAVDALTQRLTAANSERDAAKALAESRRQSLYKVRSLLTTADDEVTRFLRE